LYLEGVVLWLWLPFLSRFRIMFLFQGAALLAASLLTTSVDAVASQTFTWKNVKIGGMI